MYICSYALFLKEMLDATKYHMNANIHLVMNSFGTLFHDKIFSPTFPWLLTTSLFQIPWHFQVFQTSGQPDNKAASVAAIRSCLRLAVMLVVLVCIDWLLSIVQGTLIQSQNLLVLLHGQVCLSNEIAPSNRQQPFIVYCMLLSASTQATQQCHILTVLLSVNY